MAADVLSSIASPVSDVPARENLRDEGPPLCLPADLPRDALTMTMLGVDYVQLNTSDGGDIYLTRFGLPFWRNLLPENWYARDWFEAKRERLEGTSTVYRVPTRHVDNTALDMVVKFNRVGEVVPIDTLTVNRFINAEFNSPFEEFSLLMELRKGDSGPAGIRIRTQQPLAIYVPSRRLQLWQTGRSEDKIQAKIARHPGVELDILRQYVVLFRWIKGLDAVETALYWNLEGRERDEFLARTSSLVTHELAQKGYRVVDMKPAHVILRPQPEQSLLRDRNGQIAYALIDYELLERTPKHEKQVRDATRRFYLQQVARRFDTTVFKHMPVHLKATTLLGVDYIFGHAESTGGRLWVVGNDPDLFNFFLPERWRRTPKKKLSLRNQLYYTQTKDNINLVWKVSRMGDPPSPDSPDPLKDAVTRHGFNSPFEEFAYALELSRHGLLTVFPRAIYMTGRGSETSRQSTDDRRYRELSELRTPDEESAVRDDHDYITIWGFWRAPTGLPVDPGGLPRMPHTAWRAFRNGLIDEATLSEIMDMVKQKLRQCGLEDLNLKPDHLLVSFDSREALVRDASGQPEVRLCNLELVRRVPGADGQSGARA